MIGRVVIRAPGGQLVKALARPAAHPPLALPHPTQLLLPLAMLCCAVLQAPMP